MRQQQIKADENKRGVNYQRAMLAAGKLPSRFFGVWYPLSALAEIGQTDRPKDKSQRD